MPLRARRVIPRRWVESVREWPKFPKAAKSLKDQLGMSGLLKLDGDIRTKVKDIFSSIGELPKLAKAQQNVGSTAFAYLSFSGTDVSKQKAEAEKEAPHRPRLLQTHTTTQEPSESQDTDRDPRPGPATPRRPWSHRRA